MTRHDEFCLVLQRFQTDMLRWHEKWGTALPPAKPPTESVTIEAPFIRVGVADCPCPSSVGDIELTRRQSFALIQLLKGLRAEGALAGALNQWPPEAPVETSEHAIRWLLDQVAVTGEGGAVEGAAAGVPMADSQPVDPGVVK